MKILSPTEQRTQHEIALLIIPTSFILYHSDWRNIVKLRNLAAPSSLFNLHVRNETKVPSMRCLSKLVQVPRRLANPSVIQMEPLPSGTEIPTLFYEEQKGHWKIGLIARQRVHPRDTPRVVRLLQQAVSWILGSHVLITSSSCRIIIAITANMSPPAAGKPYSRLQ